MQAATAAGRQHGSDILAIGFGTTVAMWLLGYLSRLPGASVPSALVGVALLAVPVVGGAVAGRWTDRGWRGGAACGLLSATLNLLVLGSLLRSEGGGNLMPSALWWVPGSLALGAVLGGIGAAGASGGGTTGRPAASWIGTFARVGAAATFVLLVVGGLVTSNQAGLAVVDWPNSFGYNMFLYPLSRMTGGIYFEHAHRLFGSLVGLTTVVLAVQLHRVDDRRWLKRLGLVAVAMVIIQGVLGGLRVTGHFTLSTSRADVAPSIALAVVHGVFGQLFFATMVAVAVFTATTWRSGPPASARRTASTDRGMGTFLVGLLMVQLTLGAIQRHLDKGLLIHITLAVIVVIVALAVGIRGMGLYAEVPVVPRLARALVVIVVFQVLLGVGALIATGSLAPDEPREWWRVLLTTAHQGTGALLLASAVALQLWVRRFVLDEA